MPLAPFLPLTFCYLEEPIDHLLSVNKVSWKFCARLCVFVPVFILSSLRSLKLCWIHEPTSPTRFLALVYQIFVSRRSKVSVEKWCYYHSNGEKLIIKEERINNKINNKRREPLLPVFMLRITLRFNITAAMQCCWWPCEHVTAVCKQEQLGGDPAQ